MKYDGYNKPRHWTKPEIIVNLNIAACPLQKLLI
jgi:hypothetical protein